MKIVENAIPDLARAGVGLVLFSTWEIKNSNDQKKVANFSIEDISEREWPEGLIYYSCNLGTDGLSLMHYSQWKDEASYLRFMQESLDDRLNMLKDMIDLDGRNMLGKFRHYRSITDSNSNLINSGCIVLVHEEFESPELTPRWIDAVFDALNSEKIKHEGGISGHFHISYDGLSMVNYAEWESETAHKNSIKKSKEASAEISPLWKKVQEYRGRKNTGSVRRYFFYKSIGTE